MRIGQRPAGVGEVLAIIISLCHRRRADNTTGNGSHAKVDRSRMSIPRSGGGDGNGEGDFFLGVYVICTGCFLIPFRSVVTRAGSMGEKAKIFFLAYFFKVYF